MKPESISQRGKPRHSQDGRVGHPKFIGPVQPKYRAGPSVIRCDPDGSIWQELPLDPRSGVRAEQRLMWEAEHDRA